MLVLDGRKKGVVDAQECSLPVPANQLSCANHE